jgi:hypothetical protein
MNVTSKQQYSAKNKISFHDLTLGPKIYLTACGYKYLFDLDGRQYQCLFSEQEMRKFIAWWKLRTKEYEARQVKCKDV